MENRETINWLTRIRDRLMTTSSKQFEAMTIAIAALEQQAEDNEWCHDCKEYDKEQHCCHRFTKVIRGAVDEVNGNLAKARIEAEPAAEVAPVVHGKWIPHSEKSREYIGTVLVHVKYDYWFCDTCGYRVENGQPMYNFCPNCGAKMDGGE